MGTGSIYRLSRLKGLGSNGSSSFPASKFGLTPLINVESWPGEMNDVKYAVGLARRALDKQRSDDAA